MIEVEGVSFSYGKTDVLHDACFSLGAGETAALLGPNGAGKTTLVELMVGTLAPRQGTVRVLGVNPRSGGDEFTAQLGLVLQAWSDHGKWRVRSLLEWARQHYDAYGVQTRSVEEVLAAVDLTARADHNVSSLSGGERRRLDLAMAIIHQPRLLILDEPTTGIDPIAKRDMHDLLSDLTDLGASILFTTHDLAEADKLAERVIVLNKGVIVTDESPRAIREQLAAQAEVRWRDADGDHVHTTGQVEKFIATLDLNAISGLTIERPTLEDAYVAMVGKEEAGQ